MSEIEQHVTVYQEWRVTGQPNSSRGVDFPPYDFTWSSRHHADPERAAREFVAGMQRHEVTAGRWLDGLHLHRRTVTVTEWEGVE